MKDKAYIGLIIKQINDKLEKLANKELKTKDITFSQIRMLRALKDSEGGALTLKELEKLLCVAQSTTLGIAKRLEGKGLVEGGFNSVDKRIKYVKIMQKGKDICRKTQDHMDETEERLLKGLTKGERTLLYEMLLRIFNNIGI